MPGVKTGLFLYLGGGVFVLGWGSGHVLGSCRDSCQRRYCHEYNGDGEAGRQVKNR